MQLDDKKKGLHTRLSEQKQEFMHKMKVIEEIKRQQRKQKEQQEMLREAIKKKEAEQNKFRA